MHSSVRLVAIDIDGTLLPTFSQSISSRNAKALKAAQEAGITVAIATGRRTAYTAPVFAEMGLRANTPLITSNGAVTSAPSGGDAVDRAVTWRRGWRAASAELLRRFGALAFTFDRPGRGELVLEDPDEAQHERITLWIEANRNAIEVVKPLENALRDGDDPVQGMVAGGLSAMKKAEKALKASVWAPSVRVRPDGVSGKVIWRFWICFRRGFQRAGRWNGWRPDWVSIAKRRWRSATTGMMWTCWSGPGKA